ncbi:MAG: methyltransferase domain-containing protein [Halioglobus sp.]
MSFAATNILCCPIDRLPLSQQGNCLRCEDGHSFDLARQGYVNLLAASDKRSRDPGDSKAMVIARRDFLDSGHYQPVAHKLAEMVMPQLDEDAVLVDAGCGEGYYLHQLLQQMTAGGHSQPEIVAFDISKWAVQAAARRFSASWLVASNRNIPVVDHSVDMLLSLFGFSEFSSFHKALKPDGYLLLVGAGPAHLQELREVIYPTVKSSQSTELEQAKSGGFVLVESSTLEYRTAPLSQAEITQLLNMTPHLFRASREGKERALTLDEFPVTVQATFLLLKPQ